MPEDYSEKLDFQTLIFIAMRNYLELTTDPNTHDKRDISLINIWSMTGYFAKGNHRGKPFDFNGMFDKTSKERWGAKDAGSKIKLDAKRFGIIIKVLGKNDLLYRGVQEEDMGEKPKGADGIVIEDG